MWEQALDGQLWIRIGFAIICGGVVGVERQIRGKPVGIRTSIMICLSTTLFIYLATLVDQPNCLRVLGQLITGVGFLGAGVIMNRGGLVTGMTSASVVWMLAGIGAAIGFGYFGIAVMICAIALIVLVGVQLLEGAFKELRQGIYEIRRTKKHHHNEGNDVY
ncbi:MAG: MgtC/SapB family protein [Candidatus Omnitrophica bacterium]|nr:MgtC/SapB family protein [Candidatus Omnitrophota bacterium]